MCLTGMSVIPIGCACGQVPLTTYQHPNPTSCPTTIHMDVHNIYCIDKNRSISMLHMYLLTYQHHINNSYISRSTNIMIDGCVNTIQCHIKCTMYFPDSQLGYQHTIPLAI